MSIYFNHRTHKGNSILYFPETYIVLDIETTGFSLSHDKIIEIGAIKIHDNEIVDKFQSLINPEIEISPFISQLTNICNEELKSSPLIKEVLPELNIFLSNNIILGQNISFDINFLYDQFIENLNAPLNNDHIDLLRISKRYHNDIDNHKLSTLARIFNIDYSNAHRAVEDCIITNSIFIEYKNLILYEYGSLDNFIEAKKGTCRTGSKKVNIYKLECQDIDDIDIYHPFYNKHIAFTGELSISRKEAAQYVVNIGGICDSGVISKTNYLIVGSFEYVQNIKGSKSIKLKKAENLILKGNDLTILTEESFLEYLKPRSKSNE